MLPQCEQTHRVHSHCITIANAKKISQAANFQTDSQPIFSDVTNNIMTNIIENLRFRTLCEQALTYAATNVSHFIHYWLHQSFLNYWKFHFYTCIFAPIEICNINQKYTMKSDWMKLPFLPCCYIPRRNFRELIWTFCPALYSSSCCTQSMVLRICKFPSFSPEEGLRNQRPEPQTFFWVAPLYRWPL